MHKYTNSLIRETSPYLLQHAHNPVNWYAWNDETLEKAKKEDKPILISVGYSACHWCHVMEHESFEDEAIAALMNEHFICIKVDREERPDIDQVYMLAVQLMTGQGGWPLNCFALPDSRPVYGGTYFPKERWRNILLNLSDLYKNEPKRMLEYAVQLTEGIKMAELVKISETENKFTSELLHKTYEQWKTGFDDEYGGPNRAPKFPLPNNYQFLLRYAHSATIAPEVKQELLNHIDLTLTKMAFGGIYDQLGGGFARYSVDAYWKVPHFEKMLYDNAQLVTLYSEAFQATKNAIYKQVVYETLAFIEKELLSDEGGFYSALDADSEGEEGKFYVWKKEELQQLLKENFELFADYFNVNQTGFWEHENYILLREQTDEDIAKKHNLSINTLQQLIHSIKQQLLKVRNQRVRPALDDKQLTSWNALMLKAYIDAYKVFDEAHFLAVAFKNTNFILSNLLRADGGLYHNFKNGKATINGYLEDYCFFIEALIALYEASFKEEYLHTANKLVQYCIHHFFDKNSGMFYFTSDEDVALIARKMELADNVIPASNSSMAKSLFVLAHHLQNDNYMQISKTMLNNMLDDIVSYGAGYSNWGMLLLHFIQPFYELAIIGDDVDDKYKALNKYYIPNAIFAASFGTSSLPLLMNRWQQNKTYIYVCVNQNCKLPVTDIDDALKNLNINA
ncbi:MAG: thioredoxin domain-containing protein [Bacteroidia bacterium]